MRIRALTVLTALLLVPAAGLRAQDAPAGETTGGGSIDFGGQVSTIDGDEARYQRYRDYRSSGLLDAFRYNRSTDAWAFDMTADHVGYRDQRYTANFRQYGRASVTFLWDQLPTFYNAEDRDAFGLISATPYTGIETGQYRLDDALQAQLEAVCPTPPCAGPVNASRQALVYTLVTQQAQTLDMRHGRNTALVDARVNAMPGVDLLLRFQNVTKTGTQPWFASFGFAAANEIPGPVDHRTTDVGAALEWANDTTLVKVGWDGSWFSNGVDSLIVDNPLRLTDFTYGSAYSPGDGTSQLRMDLWPNSTMHTFSGTATHKLPYRSRVYGNLGLSSWNQDDDLLPHTINSAIPPPPLDRQTAEVQATVTSALVGLTSRPTNPLWLSVRYKLYDFDNNTPDFHITEYVRFDQVIEPPLLEHTHAFSYTRHYLDADASYNVLPFTAVRLGYSLERDDRTFRQTEATTENTVKFAVDTTGWQYVSFRAQYDFAKRTGDGLDEQVFDDLNEGFARPRQFDISDRDRHRFTVQASATPNDLYMINAQVGTFRESRPDATFGLQDSDGNFFSIGVDVTPTNQIAFGATYSKDKYTTLQRSRNANPGPQEQDPTRDWTTDVEDDVDSIYLYVDLLQRVPRTDIRWAFDWMDGVNDITYGLRPDQTIFTTVPLVQLPGASHRITRSLVDVMYRLNPRFGVGFGWVFDDYAVSDWAWNDCGAPCAQGTPTVAPTPTMPANAVSLNPPGQAGTSAQFLSLTRYLYRPYTGNTLMARVRYFF